MTIKILGNEDYQKLKVNLTSSQHQPVAISFVNPFSFYLISDTSDFDVMDGFFVDGMLLVAFLKLSGIKGISRISFDYSSVASDFFEFLSRNNLTFSFVGATQDDVLSFKAHIQSFYPALGIKFYRNGYFDSWADAVSFVNDAPPVDVILIGMGAPFQERMAILFKNSGKVRLAITCGGFISQTASRDDYYFPLVKRLNLRWAQRLIMHGHVRNKFIKTYPRFAFRFLSELIKKFFVKRRNGFRN